jgi:hypothetical protein
MNLDPGYLFLALISSSIGMGAAMYGKRAQKAKPLLIGIVLMGITYVVTSTLWLIVLTVGLSALLVVDTQALVYRLSGGPRPVRKIESIE